jgi:hypothetical protein
MEAKTIVHKWVEALRSGRYTKGKFRLKYVDRETDMLCYCCLGVLLEVLKRPSELADQGEYVFEGAYRGGLPRDVRDLINLSLEGEIGLSTMNDNTENKFSQIADHIEKLFA